jgi:peptidoglycan/xylan/chitin deacetylase (PgdA/CDA1 family)
VTGRVGKTNTWAANDGFGVPELPLLDWTALGRLADGGIAIGSHTRSHASLPALTAGQLDEEIGGAREDLAHRLGTTHCGLAYPYGAVSEAVRGSAARSHSWACTTAFREFTGDPPLDLPRIDMWYFQPPALLARWGTPSFRRWIRRRCRLRQARSALRRLLGR